MKARFTQLVYRIPDRQQRVFPKPAPRSQKDLKFGTCLFGYRHKREFSKSAPKRRSITDFVTSTKWKQNR